MNRLVAAILLLLTICTAFTSCRKDTRVFMTDGIDYKNTELEIEYASSESVRVTFSADIFTYGGTVIAKVVLVSESCVIGEVDIELYCEDDDESHYSVTETVDLSYHNYGAITAYVDKITAVTAAEAETVPTSFVPRAALRYAQETSISILT